MVDDDGTGGLLRVDLPVFGEITADALGFKQREEFFLVGHVWAGGVTKAVSAALVVLGEELSDLAVVIVSNVQFGADVFMPELGECFSTFDTDAMHVEIVSVLIRLKERLCDL